ncbi:hypothetical protein CZ774_00920 [Frigoribacterium sp. JB110]|nr:hypothetical protein CZ774_00920 [Frigoribacterium sp. JB110]
MVCLKGLLLGLRFGGASASRRTQPRMNRGDGWVVLCPAGERPVNTPMRTHTRDTPC